LDIHRLDIHLLDIFAPLPLPTDYRSPITDHRSPITDHRSPITDYRLPITDHRLPLFTSSMDVGYSSVGYFRPPFSAIPIVILFYLKPKT